MYDPEDEDEEDGASLEVSTEDQLRRALEKANAEIVMLREEVERRTARLAEVMMEDKQREEESSDEESSDDEMPSMGSKGAPLSGGGGRGGGNSDAAVAASLKAYYLRRGVGDEEAGLRVQEALRV